RAARLAAPAYRGIGVAGEHGGGPRRPCRRAGALGADLAPRLGPRLPRGGALAARQSRAPHGRSYPRRPALPAPPGRLSDSPPPRRAADALGALNELDLADPISYFQAGLVRFHQGEYERAIGAFDTQLALGGSHDELASASYYRALALVRRGRERAARADL